MVRAIIYFVLGAVVLALSIWWWADMGPGFAFLAPTITMGIGGAFIVVALAILLDIKDPTSRKL